MGRAYSATITNCYNTGTVNGSSYVGGVVGYASTANITNCYNTGNVTSTATSYSDVGGVVGSVSTSSSGTTTITNCYYGGNCSNIGGINGADEPGQAEYDSNLAVNPKDLSWYTDSTNWNEDYPWDFKNIWQINASLNDGYPAFLYQEVPIDWWTNEGNYSIEWFNNPDTTTYGDGSETNPYIIDSAEDLAGLSWLVYTRGQEDNPLVEGTDYTIKDTSTFYVFDNKHFIQSENIDLSAHVWQPIGIYYDRSGTQTQHYFSGNYDGGGHTVSGINTPAGDTDAYSYQGLFGYVHKSYYDPERFIENLGITDSNIQGYNYVGGVVGCLSGTGVFNSYNSASVSASGNLVGGIAGWARPASVPIEKSYNTGSISGVNYVGGITGEFNDMDSGYMSAVFNRGSVTGTNYVGGISGGTAILYEAYNTGTVSGSDYVGGILSGSRYNGSDFSGAGGGSTSIIVAFNIGQVISSGTNVDPIIVSVGGSVSQTYYGGSSLSEVAGANGTYIADLDTQAKTLTFLRDTLGLDFATKWQMDTENVNEGYPIFRFDSDTWIGTGNYSATLLGSGTTAQDPYQIWNAADLAAIAYALQSGEFNGETLTPVVDASMNGANIYFSDFYFEQKADIDLSAHYWEPIGSMLGAMTGGSMTGFGGQYDGGNFEISGLRSLRGYNFQAGEGVSSSLFGLLVGDSTSSEKTAQIKNVHLTDADFSVQMYSGAIAGVSINARIENCSVAGKCSTVSGSGAGSGGMVGMAMMSEIDNCINYCEQTVLMDSSSSYGGIVGMSQMSTISNCANFGLIDGGSSEMAAPAGIVGSLAASQITSSSNFGPVNGYMAAGVAMMVSGNCSITGCNNYGTITGDRLSSGIVGSVMSGTMSITDCANFGTLNASTFLAGIIGMIGNSGTYDITISNCVADFATQSSSTPYLSGIYATVVGSGYDSIQMTIDKCSVNLKINALSASSYNVFTDMSQQSDIYSITTTNSYGTVSVNGAIEARALTDDTSAMEGNFIYLTGLNGGRPLPIKTDGSYFFHQHTFGTTTGILDQINEVFYPNLAAQPLTFNTTYRDTTAAPPLNEDMWQQVSLGLVDGKTYSIDMTIDGTSVSRTATASYVDLAAAPNSAISLGGEYLSIDLDSSDGRNDYTLHIVENAILAEDFSYIYTPGQMVLMGYAEVGAPSVPVVITAIREVA